MIIESLYISPLCLVESSQKQTQFHNSQFEQSQTYIRVSSKTLKMGTSKIGLAKEYFDNATIHGCRYIVHQGSSWIEKVMWAIILLFFSSLGIYFINQSFSQWKEKPVLRTIGN